MITFKFLDPELRFRLGKHKDKHISEVDRFYLKWCINEGREKMKPLEVDIFTAFIKHKQEYTDKMGKEKHSCESCAGKSRPPNGMTPNPPLMSNMGSLGEELPF